MLSIRDIYKYCSQTPIKTCVASVLQLQKCNLRGLPTAEFKDLSENEESVKQINPFKNSNLGIPVPTMVSLPNFEKTENHEKTKTVKKVSSERKDQGELMPFNEESLVPTFNLAAYVNSSPTLQQLVKLGVNLHRIERKKGLAQFVLTLDFERDVKPYLLFLKDQGVSPDIFGEFISKNPLLFKVDFDDLQTRINYLQSKDFSSSQITRILSRNPFWLMFSTQRIDRRLGHFQQEFRLSGDDVRFLASKQPRLITYNMEHIRKSTFCIREEMGFDKDEEKCLLLNKPRLWMMNSDELVERFAYAHKEMGLSHEMLLQFPEILCSREFRLRQRHEFLKMLGRAQYNPEADLYVSPKSLVEGNDYVFVKDVAKSDLETYNLFLKTR